LREWFRLYKTVEGKGPNKFGLNEQAMDKTFAMKVAFEAHESWKALAKDPKVFLMKNVRHSSIFD
jgi:hypothetical protein